MQIVRFIGQLEAQTPIHIVRSGQGERPLMTNIVVNGDSVGRRFLTPGDTLKGIFRRLAFDICAAAARRKRPNLQISPTDQLTAFYRQILGGLEFEKEVRELGVERELRRRQPILSLFGTANAGTGQKLTGCMTVWMGIARQVNGLSERDPLGVPPGFRRDPLIVEPELADLLNDEAKRDWEKRTEAVAERSKAEKAVETAKKKLDDAKLADDPDEKSIKALQKEISAGEKRLKELEAVIAVTRPLPTKPAHPAGMIYEHRWEVLPWFPHELGLFLATMSAWNIRPRIGGSETTGYGHVTGHYDIEVHDGAGSWQDDWQPAGKMTIGVRGQKLIDSQHPMILEALEAWKKLEENILEETDIFA